MPEWLEDVLVVIVVCGIIMAAVLIVAMHGRWPSSPVMTNLTHPPTLFVGQGKPRFNLCSFLNAVEKQQTGQLDS